jgi:hypothetical protein
MMFIICVGFLIIRGLCYRSRTHKTSTVNTVKDLVVNIKNVLQEIVPVFKLIRELVIICGTTYCFGSFCLFILEVKEVAFQIILKSGVFSFVPALAILWWVFKHEGKHF